MQHLLAPFQIRAVDPYRAGHHYIQTLANISHPEELPVFGDTANHRPSGDGFERLVGQRPAVRVERIGEPVDDGLRALHPRVEIRLRAAPDDQDHVVPAEVRRERVQLLGEGVHLARVEVGVGPVGDHEGEEREVGEGVLGDRVGHRRRRKG